jgi:hypothetical protein
MGRECGMHVKDGICLKRLVGDLNGKKHPGRIRYRWEGSVTMRLMELQTVRV